MKIFNRNNPVYVRWPKDTFLTKAQQLEVLNEDKKKSILAKKQELDKDKMKVDDAVKNSTKRARNFGARPSGTAVVSADTDTGHATGSNSSPSQLPALGGKG